VPLEHSITDDLICLIRATTLRAPIGPEHAQDAPEQTRADIMGVTMLGKTLSDENANAAVGRHDEIASTSSPAGNAVGSPATWCSTSTAWPR
jgi:hypothetical protein